MNKLSLALATLLTVGCTSTKQPEYILQPDGPRLSRDDAQKVFVEQNLASQIRVPLDKPLKVISATLPGYPEGIRRGDEATSGVVRVTFVVNSDGSVSDAAIVGRPNPILAALCLDSVLRWRFEPITRNGAPTTQRLTFEFVFKLEG